MKAYVQRVKVQPHAFLNSTLNGCESSASCPGEIMPGQRTPCNNSIWDCVRCRAGLGISETRKSLASTGIRIPVYPACSSFTILTIHCSNFYHILNRTKISFHKHG